ncbi:tRNA guanosine(15) transglycosylase TgtA, partial [Candidatus Bathyarchaeota archaeon]
MAFEIREHDLAGRVGRLKTRSGVIETPALLPVINPKVQPITPREMREKFKLKAVITNAYILMKNFRDSVVKEGVHRFLDFDGVVMTDSGAYQLLIYGEIDAMPHEVVEFQELIGSDIATILDVPTGWRVSRRRAEETVETTIRRAKELFHYRSREDILWVGPIQGGLYLDLVEEAARRMSTLPFQIYALGSPTALMENYLFTDLIDMIVSARRHIPESRPFHLFGAGHPFM